VGRHVKEYDQSKNEDIIVLIMKS